MTHTLALRLLPLGLALLALPAPAPAAQRRARQRRPPAAEQQQPAAKPAEGQQPQARQITTAIIVRWQGRPGVSRYRLQLATDDQFQDVVFDQAVEGHQHVVRGLPPGNYFWRVAAAAAETSPFYSRPERVAVSETTTNVSDTSNVFMPDESAGWRTATGEVTRLVPARLRQGTVVDVVGVGADGRVFALDGVSGVSLWNARYAERAGTVVGGAPFTPLVLPAQQGSDVVVAYEGGVRALRGDSGREVWRARLEGRATSGTAADLNGDGRPEVVVVTAGPSKFYALDAATGRVAAEKSLDAEAVGAPYAMTAGETRGVILALRNNRLEIRSADGAVVKSEQIEGELTTPPLVIGREGMTVLVVGTDQGLAALSIPDLKLLGRIVAEDDRTRGVLAAADVEGDGATEIVMVTRRGRVALVSSADGNVRWFAEGATDASAATFADLNGDKVLDVIVPGGADFALGFSGADGSLLMRVEEGGRPAEARGEALRSLVVTQTPTGAGLLVGGDPARVGLRAVELPKGDGSAASN